MPVKRCVHVCGGEYHLSHSQAVPRFVVITRQFKWELKGQHGSSENRECCRCLFVFQAGSLSGAPAGLKFTGIRQPPPRRVGTKGCTSDKSLLKAVKVHKIRLNTVAILITVFTVTIPRVINSVGFLAFISLEARRIDASVNKSRDCTRWYKGKVRLIIKLK